MESGNWLRVGAIGALFLAAVYVLVPSFVLTGTSAELAEKTAAVDTSGSGKAKLDLHFTVDGPTANGAVAIEKHLAAQGVNIDIVEATPTEVVVTMAIGTTKDQVVAALAAQPEKRLVRLVDATPVPAEGEELPTAAESLVMLPESVRTVVVPLLETEPAQAAALATLAGQKLDATLPGAAIALGPLDVASKSFPIKATAGTDLGLLLVALDQKVVGVAIPGPASAAFVPLYPANTDHQQRLSAQPLSVKAKLVEEEVAEVVDPTVAADATVVESPLPLWMEGLFLESRINLGIDLQGGVDLTLQVELDDAIQARVTRDAAALRSDIVRDFGKGADDGASADPMAGCNASDVPPGELDDAWLATNITTDRHMPLIKVDTVLSLADAQSYLLRRFENYTYIETLPGAEAGRSIHVFTLAEDQQERIKDEAVDQVLETLRRRVDATGVKEPSIVKKGGGRINVQLPGRVDLDAAVNAIGTTAVLEFLLVETELEKHLRESGLEGNSLEDLRIAVEEALPEDQYNDDDLVDRWLHEQNLLPIDRTFAWHYEETTDGQEIRTYPTVLKADPAPLTGQDVSDAGVGWDQAQQAVVSLSFKQRGSFKFCEMTSENTGKPFAIMLDRKVISAPNIRSAICGGRAQIEMGGSIDPLKEAQTLAIVLRTGSLNAPVSIGDVRVVGSTLGADAIEAGTEAALIGGVLVVLFMALWYRTAGMVANFALVMNVLLVLAALALFGATLTLPGLAGIALTVGMAVDANIIIYERIREELKLGQHARKAVDAGFEKAVVAVLDANITTGIAGVVLYSYGTGPIKGFAVTLLVGIVTTLITALFINRTLMELLTRNSSARLRI